MGAEVLIILAIVVGTLLGHGIKDVGFQVQGKQMDQQQAAKNDVGNIVLLALALLVLIALGGGNIGGVAIGGGLMQQGGQVDEQGLKDLANWLSGN